MFRINSSAGANALAGHDTSWCIARKSGSYYNQYTSTNQIFYFCINKTLPVDNPLQKVAVRVTKDINTNEVSDINYTSKINDGDNKDPSELPWFSKVKGTIENDALKQPPTLLVKVKHGKATPEEEEALWKSYKSATLEEKQQLNQITNNAFDDKLDQIESTEFGSIPSNWKELDAVFIEKLIHKFNDDNFYNKVLDLHNPHLDKVIAKKTNNAFIMYKILSSIPKNDDLGIKNIIVNKKNCPQQVLEVLSNDEDYYVRHTVAQHPNTPASILERLSNDENYIMRQVVGRNPNTPADILERLSNDKNISVRDAVAQNPNTPASILERLSNDKIYYVRLAVGRNPNTPVDILERLSNDKNPDVRFYVGSNPNTPVNILEILSNNENFYARQFVAGNPNTPVDILERLSNDEDSYVRAAALYSLKKRKNTNASILYFANIFYKLALTKI